MAPKLATLIVKNIQLGTRQFFAPLNRLIPPMATIDVLKMCDGDSALAQKVVEPYRSKEGWQVFEIFEKLPSPEGLLDNGVTVDPGISDSPSNPGQGGKKRRKHHREEQDEAPQT